MDIRYLEYILVLAEISNMIRAAGKFYISQPALSQFLSKQEQELGAPLFQRTGGVYALTPVGHLYADYAWKVLTPTDILKKDIQHISTASRIRIGTSASRALQTPTSILADFRKYYSRVELALSDDNLRAMRNATAKGEIDIALVIANALDQCKGQSLGLKKEEVVLAAPISRPYCQSLKPGKHYSLISRQVLEHSENTPFILQLKGSCIRYLVGAFFGKDFNLIIACSTNHAQSIYDMVSSNTSAGFIPTGYVVDSPRITYFPLEPKMYRIHAILFRKDLIAEPPHKYLVKPAQKYVEKNWKNLQILLFKDNTGKRFEYRLFGLPMLNPRLSLSVSI